MLLLLHPLLLPAWLAPDSFADESGQRLHTTKALERLFFGSRVQATVTRAAPKKTPY